MDLTNTTVSSFLLVVGLALAFAVWFYQKGLKYMHNKYYDYPTKKDFNKNYDIILEKENERRKAILEKDAEERDKLYHGLVIDALTRIVVLPADAEPEKHNPYQYCAEIYNKILSRCEDTKYLEEQLCEEMLDVLVHRLIRAKNSIDYYESKYLKLNPAYFYVSARKKDDLNRYQVTLRYDGFKFDDRFKDINFEDYGWDNDKVEANFDIDSFSLISDADLYTKTGDITYYIKWLDMQLEYLLTKDAEKRGN